eukprot:scaffold6634_cov158-Amphora_coffeaeformis.AAC.16
MFVGERSHHQLNGENDTQDVGQNAFPKTLTNNEHHQKVGTLQNESNVNDHPVVPKSDADPSVKQPRLDLALVANATTFLHERKHVYDELGLGFNWHLRGIAYLAQRSILLAGYVHLPTPPSSKGQVIIQNVYPSALQASTPSRDDCGRLTIWVRVRGPEIMAGTARAIQPSKGNCFWVYDFDLQVPGDYVVESKALMWNADINHTKENRCAVNKGNVSEAIKHKYPQHRGFRGFKIYNAAETCCEICSRQKDPPCRYWASPPERLADPSFSVNGCELYFDADVADDDLPFLSPVLGDLKNYTFTGFDKALGVRRRLRLRDQRRRLVGITYAHGYPHNGPVPYFVGCGWNQMFAIDFPCVSGELDDKVVFTEDSFSFQLPGSAAVSKVTTESLRQCTQKDEMLDTSKGRWVKQDWPNPTECPTPFEFDKTYTARFKITAKDPDHPRCWHRDDLSIQGYSCAEMNCRFLWPGSRWESSFREPKWMGAWRQYDCDYFEYTDDQLETCFATKKIGTFLNEGASVSDSFKQNLQLRLHDVKLYNETNGDAVTVTLSTLALLHKALKTDDEVRQSFEKMPDIRGSTKLVYIATGFFLTSERETHCTAARMRQLNSMIEEILVPKGYLILNAHDLSTAVSYETAGQFDGMVSGFVSIALDWTDFYMGN